MSTTITIDSCDYSQKSQLSADLKLLALSCLPNRLREDDLELEKNDLGKIVGFTHDLCLNLEDGYTFRVHKCFIAERCEYFRTFLHDPFNETREHPNENKNAKNVSELNLRQISAEVLTEIVVFLYSNEFSRPKVS